MLEEGNTEVISQKVSDMDLERWFMIVETVMMGNGRIINGTALEFSSPEMGRRSKVYF
jgi:hypothetical protein